ncbi:unnamed protein product [Blepharisma stoltei]|uniref:Uncharacterized protein n=1 Tax=Blepharisma stoltei TaxID=1481888 RepID=A0AAU9INB2_9CILI|nr:unnamed protein product [Blepharisma stoltei]
MVIYDTLGEWMFFTFYWVDVSGTITWKIYSQDDNKEATGTNPAYVWPNLLDVGYKMNGYFYEIIVHKGALSTQNIGSYKITLLDDQEGSYVAMNTGIGSSPCSDISHPKYGCLSIDSTCQCPALCTSCDSTGVCQGCTVPYRILSTEC